MVEITALPYLFSTCYYSSVSHLFWRQNPRLRWSQGRGKSTNKGVIKVSSNEPLFSKETLQQDYAHLDRLRLFIDQYIDIMLNHRQSGHPGGPRAKAHQMVALMATGAMRWDVRDPLLPFADRFVLTAGHCIPLIYAALAVVNHAMELRYQWTGDEKYKVKGDADHILLPDDLLTLRYHGGLPGHAEFAGKTLFIKFNTGPSGHGAPAAAGIALALKHAGCEDVNVFMMEGEGGHTAGAHHETKIQHMD
jgi:transketolase